MPTVAMPTVAMPTVAIFGKPQDWMIGAIASICMIHLAGEARAGICEDVYNLALEAAIAANNSAVHAADVVYHAALDAAIYIRDQTFNNPNATLQEIQDAQDFFNAIVDLAAVARGIAVDAIILAKNAAIALADLAYALCKGMY